MRAVKNALRSGTHAPLSPTVTAYLDTQALQELQEMLGDDLYEITSLYGGTLADEVETLKTTFASSNWAVLNRQAHSLKGSSANMGALEMARLAALVEKAALQADAAVIKPALDAMAGAAEATLNAMRSGGYLKT